MKNNKLAVAVLDDIRLNLEDIKNRDSSSKFHKILLNLHDAKKLPHYKEQIQSILDLHRIEKLLKPTLVKALTSTSVDDIPEPGQGGLNKRAYGACVKTQNFSTAIRILDAQSMLLPLVFKRDGKTKRRFAFYATSPAHGYELIEFYMPVWAFFKEPDMEYCTETGTDKHATGRFNVTALNKDGKRKIIPSKWKIKQNTCHIETKAFTTIIKIDLKTYHGSIVIKDKRKVVPIMPTDGKKAPVVNLNPSPDLTARGTVRINAKPRSSEDIGGNPKSEKYATKVKLMGRIPRALNEEFLDTVNTLEQHNQSSLLEEAIKDIILKHKDISPS